MEETAALMGGSKNDSCFPSLSIKQRVIGFLVCEVLGILIQLLSFGTLLGIVTGNLTKFAITYSLGNVVSLIGTSFLKGPAQQCKDMVNPKRLLATVLFLGALVGTVVSAIVVKKGFLILICVVVQYIAYIYYCITLIPFGTKAVAMGLKASGGGDML